MISYCCIFLQSIIKSRVKLIVHEASHYIAVEDATAERTHMLLHGALPTALSTHADLEI